jgi:hypothetical protein
MVVAVDEPRREALLEQMSLPPVTTIEPLSVDPEHAVHGRREEHAAPFGDEVEVRAEDTPGVHAKAEPGCGVKKERREGLAVDVIEEREDPAGAAGGHVVRAVGEMGSRPARHAPTDGRGRPLHAPADVTVPSQGLSLGRVR